MIILKKVLVKSKPVLVVLELFIFISIFALKLLEYLLYIIIADGYPAIIISIFDSDCILVSAYSLLIFIIIYFYLRNRMSAKRKVLIILVIVLLFTIALIYLVVVAFSYSFPTNLRICRSIGLLLSIITCAFIIYKGLIVKH